MERANLTLMLLALVGPELLLFEFALRPAEIAILQAYKRQAASRRVNFYFAVL